VKDKDRAHKIGMFGLIEVFLFCTYVFHGISFLDSVVYSLIPAVVVTLIIDVFGESSEKTTQSKPKKVKRLKKPKTSKRRGFISRLFAKLRLWNMHREWRKSDNGRSIPKMQRQFKKWAKLNPEMAETIEVVISQMHQLAVDHDVFEDVVEDSKYGYKGQDSREVFDHTASQIRQNFNDIYNIMILAGANEGQATLKTVDLNALAWELNGNRTKLTLLAELNTQIVRLVNQIDSVHDNVMTEAEINALAYLNAMRFSKAAGFAAEMNTEANPESKPPAGTTASTP